MKKLLIFGISVIASLMLTLTVARAGCPPPSPTDYPMIPWIGPFTYGPINYPAGTSCMISVEWCWRTTPWNGGEIEIYIGAVTYTGVCHATVPLDLSNTIKDMSLEIITNVHPWTTTDGGAGHPILDVIPPCPAQSTTRYRILHASCYTPLYAFPTGFTRREPCDVMPITGSCEQFWTLCWNTSVIPNVLQETVTAYVNNGATCPEKMEGTNYNCQLVCP